MEDKFNFYDFVGYVLPGGIAVALAYWFCTLVLGLPWSLSFDNLGESVLLLGLAYAAGHMVQVLGSRIESRHSRRWGGYFSCRFMRDNDRQYTSEFKKNLKESIEQTFGLAYAPPGSSTQDEDVRTQELFNLCYALLVQENASRYVEIFNGMYSLYRGWLATSWLGLGLSIIALIKQVVLGLFVSPGLTAQATAWAFDLPQLASSLLALILFIVSIRLLSGRLQRFGERFADSVYRHFFAWYRRKQLSASNAPAAEQGTNT